MAIDIQVTMYIPYDVETNMKRYQLYIVISAMNNPGSCDRCCLFRRGGMLGVILKQSETRHSRCQSGGEGQSATDKGWHCASLQQS